MTGKKMKIAILISCTLALCLMLTASPTAAQGDSPQALAQKILKKSDIQGGLIVHLGCGDGKLTSALKTNDMFMVHGLDKNSQNIEKARQYLHANNQYGPVAVDHLLSNRLPYIDNSINLLVAENPSGIAEKEIRRVLCPNGVALIKQEGEWKRIEKPRPDTIDDWTHYLHDPSGNPVAHDQEIAPPRHLQWVGSPRWSRHHDHMSSISALVTCGSRVFYIVDEGPTASIELPSDWQLVARDAFNGKILWKRSIDSWQSQLWPLKSGPSHLPRRLVVQDDAVYVTLGIDEPISVLDPATGDTLREYDNTAGTEEILFSGGNVIALVNPDPEAHRYAKIGQYRGFYNGDYWQNIPKRIVSIQPKTGETLWEYKSPILPVTLAADKNQVYFHDGDRLLALNKENGEKAWQSTPIPRSEKMASFFAPVLVVHDGVVLFAGGERAGLQHGEWYTTGIDTMSAVSAEDGKILWQADHPPSGYRSPEDLIVMNNLVWTGETTSGRVLGLFRGRNLKNGQVQKEFIPDVNTYWFHHRCYRSKATDNFLLTSRTGIEFIDPKTEHWETNHWVRGACLYGIMPANGLVYAPPHPCACYLESKLSGFNALAPATESRQAILKLPNYERLVRGPAYNAIQAEKDGPSGWPTYRGNNARSGFTTTAVPAKIKPTWETKLGGDLTSLVVSNGRIFVASKNNHQVHALDASSGKPIWHFTAGGRVDSPPTIYEGQVLFGSADGYVYSLRASDGALAWKFLAAPADRRLISYEQIESVWPVHGSVLVKNDVLYCVAGRSMFIDGGMRLWRLNPLTGDVISKKILDTKDHAAEKDIQDYITWLNMPPAMPDIMACEEDIIYMKSQPYRLDGTRLPLKKYSSTGNADAGAPPAIQHPEHAHLFCPTGYLDDSWWHRTYWLYGSDFISGWCGYYRAGKTAPSGRILVFDEKNVYGFGRLPKYYRWTTPLEYHLFAASKHPKEVANTDRKGKNQPKQEIDFKWTQTVPILPRAMAMAGKTIFIAGPEDMIDEEKSLQRLTDSELLKKMNAQTAALEGKKGSTLFSISAKDGNKVAEINLDAMPVWDGMAIADNSLFMATTDGKVLRLK